MTAKIVKLTPSQELDLVAHRDAWRAIGTRTGHDADCAAVGRSAVVDSYKEIGVEPPALVLWAQSPLQALLMHWALRGILTKAAPTTIAMAKSGSLRDQLWGQLGGQLQGQLEDQLGGQLQGQLRDQLVDQLRGQLWDQLVDQLEGQLRDQLVDQLRGQLWDQLVDQLWDQLGDQLAGQLRGQLKDQLWGQLSGQLWGQLSGQLGDLLWGQLGDQLGSQLRGQLRGQLWDQLGDQLVGQLRGQLRDQLQGQLQDQLQDQLQGQLQGQLGGQLRGQLKDQLGGQLWGQLGGQLRGQLRGQLGDQLGSQLWSQLQGQLRSQLQEAFNQTWCWGQCEGYWTAWARFAISIGVKVTAEQERRLQIMERLARSAFMVLSWRGVTILVQRPSAVSFDARHRLHRTDGPALAWPDGYAVYAINGVRLTPQRGAAMVAGTLTAAEIRDEPNAEVRRVLVATYNSGDTGRYLRDVGATVIHADVDLLGLPRRLLRIDQEGDEPFIGIEVTNSTPEPDGTRKLYTFRCDPELRTLPIRGICDDYGAPQELTCQNAIASTYGYLGSEYRPVIET